MLTTKPMVPDRRAGALIGIKNGGAPCRRRSARDRDRAGGLSARLRPSSPRPGPSIPKTTRPTPSSGAPPGGPTCTARMTKTSLIVEDHADIRKLLRMTLEFEGHAIHEAGDGPTGVEMARAIHPDVVLLDVMMPGAYDGLEACRRLRADPAFAATRIILLSARGQSQDIENGLAAGADAYLLKPFSPLQLLRTIEDPA